MRKVALILGLLLLPASGGLWAAEVAAVREADKTAGPRNGEEKVSVSLVSADLRAVVTALARAHNINLVGSDKLSGKVTLHLNNAPVLQALEIILKNAGFVLMPKENGIYEIMTTAESAKVQKAGAVPRVQIFTLKYADVEKVAKLLVPNAIPEAKSIASDPASNQLIIGGTAEQFKKVEQIIEAVDRPVPQVVIRARIVEIFTDRANSVGVSIGALMECDKVSDGGDATFDIDLTQSPVAASTFAFGLVTRLLDIKLNALAQKEVAEVLSAPKVTTGHGRKAEIKVVNQVPVITRQTRVVDGVTITDETVTFKETGLTLVVTPRVLAENKVEMVVVPSVLELTGWTDTQPPAPIIDTRSAETTVTIEDGKWLVIGGLMRYNERKMVRGLPVLKDLPGIGWLFSTTYTIREQSNLVIFVSATVLNNERAQKDTDKELWRIQKHRRPHDMHGGPFPPPEDPADFHPIPPQENGHVRDPEGT